MSVTSEHNDQSTYAGSAKQVNYTLDDQGCFVIENYHLAKPFSNFFPGVAGLWGIPMWVFFVNRGQCISSFGIESKDKSILEFQPANKAYRQTSTQGFRTFIKARLNGDEFYWEPFQKNLIGTNYKKNVRMSMTAYDLTLVEVNYDLNLVIEVNYFTVPEEPYAGIIRRVKIKNTGDQPVQMEVCDGLPAIVPYGVKDVLNKNISRTIEAWMKVRNLDQKAPYYQLNVEVADTSKVTHIKEGNFFFSFDPDTNELIDPIVEPSVIFAEATDFHGPDAFLNGPIEIPAKQQTSNRTPCAFSRSAYALNPGDEKQIVSMFGYADSVDQLNSLAAEAMKEGYVDKKCVRNKEVINQIKDNAFTHSSSQEYNLYCEHTFLDNILRGGLPVSIKTSDGHVAFNVYSRKHGDPERDYNFFTVSPTYYSQGNGNYRDVNQNRRNDAWFNAHVKDQHLINFLNLSQADGYNPLVVRGTSFQVHDQSMVNAVLERCVEGEGTEKLKEYLTHSFQPGELLKFVDTESIRLKVKPWDFLGQVLEICHKQELADHGEGFWSDHWTYNLDLIESFLSVYPEELKRLLLDSRDFHFYFNNHYVLGRDHRYILTESGVRQYHSVQKGVGILNQEKDFKLRVKNGDGAVYKTHMTCKLLCLIANKAATLDPSGVGVEMEADKPNWYDALNGLPGLLGSSLSETLELKRLSIFLLESIKQLSLEDSVEISVFDELASFVSGLSSQLSLDQDVLAYWNRSNDIKEHYRMCIRHGIDGKEAALTVGEIKTFLSRVIDKTQKAFESARREDGSLTTYLYHEVTDHTVLERGAQEGKQYVKPNKFKRHDLPQFLEGYVHALRVEAGSPLSKDLYEAVRRSDLFDKKLKMYKVNESLQDQSEEIGRTRIFPSGWLENESVWLHMEYKFMLELLRCNLFDEFFDNFKDVMVPFLSPEIYGRSVLENSSFIVSGAHEDDSLHGQGFVARLSGSTAEFMHIWLYMNAGKRPFELNENKELILSFKPILPGWLFTTEKKCVKYFNQSGECRTEELDDNTYSFIFLGHSLVVYHNPTRANTYGANKANIKEIRLSYGGRKNPVTINSSVIPTQEALDIRERKVERIDVYFE